MEIIFVLNGSLSYLHYLNRIRLGLPSFMGDVRKYCFTNRIVNTWNGLPNWVISAKTTNTFKNRLDKFWQNQEIIYDFQAQLEGAGSHSEVWSLIRYYNVLSRVPATGTIATRNRMPAVACDWLD